MYIKVTKSRISHCWKCIFWL